MRGRQADAGLHVRRRRGGGHGGGQSARDPRGCLQYWWRLAGGAAGRVRAHRPGDRPSPAVEYDRAAGRRHARYLGRTRGAHRRSWVRPWGHARAGAAGTVSVDDRGRPLQRMNHSRLRSCASGRIVLFVVATAWLAACGGNPTPVVPAGNAAPDQFLFERANDSMKRQRWLDARKYFQQIVDNYPQSTLRPDAKLGVGDSYLSEGGDANVVLAENEFREFITFYPTSARVDYARYKLAMTHFRRMKAPERDQTQTVAAVREFEVFFKRYPNSMLTPEVREKRRDARSRVSEASDKGVPSYYRARWYPGAINPFHEALKQDPNYPDRDAVYYYLAESLLKTDKKAEADPYYDRLVKEFDRSEYLVDARKRLETLATQ